MLRSRSAAEDVFYSGMGVVVRPWFAESGLDLRKVEAEQGEKQKSPHRCGLFSVS